MESWEKKFFRSVKCKLVLHPTIKTPEKTNNPPRRFHNSNKLFSPEQVRQAALKLRKPNSDLPNRPDPLSSSSKSTVSQAKIKVKLPEKYEELDKFFICLDNTITSLKGTIPTFSNISHKIEGLTDRRFTYVHLAQLKYVLSEAIEVKKIFVLDEHTGCHKPDLHVTLNANAIGSDGNLKVEGGGLSLTKIFRSRLLEFFKKNPEVNEIPEETLPEPFNRTNHVTKSSLASHLSQSFQRRFSKQVSNLDVVQVNQEQPRASFQTSDQTLSVSSNLPETPIKIFHTEKKEEFSSKDTISTQGTPVKLVSTPLTLMSNTPAQKPQKRPIMRLDEDEDEDLVRPTTKLARLPRTSRSLKFDTPVKNSILEDETLSVDDDDVFNILSDNLVESIREKEKKALEEKDLAISQAKWRHQMIASLPKLFDMLLFLFQSINRSVFTKQELVQRIISCHLEIVDRQEVEEQLRLLQELVPEWIHEKKASSGDLLLCVNKFSCPVLMRTRLSEAK